MLYAPYETSASPADTCLICVIFTGFDGVCGPARHSHIQPGKNDTIDSLTLIFNAADPYGTLDAEIEVNLVVDPDLCEADGNPADGCTYNPATGALVIGTTGGLSIPAGQTATFKYQVTIF